MNTGPLRRPAGVQAIFDDLAAMNFRSLAEAQAFLDRRMRAYNATPQAELNGLSPEQMVPVLDGNWQTGEGLRLATDLTATDLAESGTLFNALAVLGALRDEGPAAATATGNFSRSFVAKMLDRLRLEGDPPGYFLDRREVVNEMDVWPLHIVRSLLVLSGLVIRRKGFRISKRGKLLSEGHRAAELFGLLFRTYFRDLNLSYTDSLPDQPGLQSGIAYSFWTIRRAADDWVGVRDLSRSVWPPRLSSPAPPASIQSAEESRWRMQTWLVIPLAGFGLLEMREVRNADFPFGMVEVRKTPLFDRFLFFRFGVDVR